MGIVNGMGFVLFVFGVFQLLGLSFLSFLKESKEKISRFSVKRKKSLAKRVEEIKKPKQQKGFTAVILGAEQMLLFTGRKELLSWISFLALLFAGAGVMTALSMGNYFLVPVLAAGAGILPFIYILFLSIRWQRELNEELETALSIITTSYLRKEDIIAAVAENAEYLNEPVKSVFQSFLVQTKYISGSTKKALRALQGKIKHEIFWEWCEALILCQDNKELKVTLSPIVSKLSDTRVVSEELNNILYEPVKDYVGVFLLFFANFPLIRVLNKDWYSFLMDTTIGKLAVAVAVALVLFTVPGVIALTRPVTYRGK